MDTRFNRSHRLLLIWISCKRTDVLPFFEAFVDLSERREVLLERRSKNIQNNF